MFLLLEFFCRSPTTTSSSRCGNLPQVPLSSPTAMATRTADEDRDLHAATGAGEPHQKVLHSELWLYSHFDKRPRSGWNDRLCWTTKEMVGLWCTLKLSNWSVLRQAGARTQSHHARSSTRAFWIIMCTRTCHACIYKVDLVNCERYDIIGAFYVMNWMDSYVEVAPLYNYLFPLLTAVIGAKVNIC